MIDAKELHIGCWYNFKNTTNGKFTPIRFSNWAEGLDFEAYAEGIALTPEWLELFGGYMQDKTPFYCIDMPRNIGEININPDNGMVWLRHFRNENISLNPASGEKYYVHQLQNLYFALTGEELTIKSFNQSN